MKPVKKEQFLKILLTVLIILIHLATLFVAFMEWFSFPLVISIDNINDTATYTGTFCAIIIPLIIDAVLCGFMTNRLIKITESKQPFLLNFVGIIMLFCCLCGTVYGIFDMIFGNAAVDFRYVFFVVTGLFIIFERVLLTVITHYKARKIYLYDDSAVRYHGTHEPSQPQFGSWK